jgi:hypothetical protein
MNLKKKLFEIKYSYNKQENMYLFLNFSTENRIKQTSFFQQTFTM